MIYSFLHRHLPTWLATIVIAAVYAALIIAVWLRWHAPSAPFRYLGI